MALTKIFETTLHSKTNCALYFNCRSVPSPQSHSLPAAVRLDAHPERPDGADLERPNVVNLADMRVAGHPPHARHVVLHRQLPVPKRLVATAANAIFMKRITCCSMCMYMHS